MPWRRTPSGRTMRFGNLKAYAKARTDVDISHPTPQGEAVKHDWVEFFQGVEEEIPLDMPPHKGKPVVSTTAVCLQTRRLSCCKF